MGVPCYNRVLEKSCAPDLMRLRSYPARGRQTAHAWNTLCEAGADQTGRAPHLRRERRATMAKAERAAKRGIGSRLFGLLNPIRDPSLLVAPILTFIERGSSSDPIPVILLWGVGNWIAVKGVIWLLVNFAFSFVYLLRKGGWVMRNPRLAWRLLDALGTEEIIIGGLRPDMFATDDGSLHEGQLGMAAMMGGHAGAYSGGLSGPAYGYDQGYDDPQYDDYGDNSYAQNGRQPQPSLRLDGHSAEMSEMLGQYAKLISDWMAFTEEKWRAVSDSQLGWKPLRGRWE